MKNLHIACGTVLLVSLLAGAGALAANDASSAASPQRSNEPDVSQTGQQEVQPAPNSAGGRTQSESQSSGGGAGAQSSASSAGAQSQAGHPVVYVLVPLEVVNTSAAMKNGCWARIYGGPNFTGDTLTLSGPFDLPRMVGPFGIDWKNKVRSIEVGNAATVTVYDNENFKDQVTQFKPGARAADVSKRMGFFDDFSSMKIACGK